METNNFTNQENPNNLENSNFEKEIDIIDGEGEVDILELEAKVKGLERKNQEEIDQYNKIRKELGLDTLDSKNEEEVAQKLPSLTSRLENIKKIGKKLIQAAAFTGVMFGTTDAFSASNTGPINNDKKKEIKTEVGDFYFKLQEYKLIPESMTALEFQEKVKDENWMKDIVEKYKEARGIKSIPGGEVIKEIKYGLNTEEKLSKKVLSQEERQKKIKEIWKDVSSGKYKMGDTITLSDGSSYVIKKYKPDTYKTNTSNQGDVADVTNKFEFLEDYTKTN